MVRPVQCPECGEINSVEVPGEKALKGVGDGPLYSGEVFGINIKLQADGQAYFNCNWCDEELSIIYNEEKRGKLFHIEKTIKTGYQAFEFSYDREIIFVCDIIVRDGNSIDLHLTTDDEYKHFTNEERFRTLESKTDVLEAEMAVNLSPGEYWCVVEGRLSRKEKPENMPKVDLRSSAADREWAGENVGY